MVYTLSFFSSKCSLFHYSNVFGSCIIHILYTGCAKIKKSNSGAKRLIDTVVFDYIPFPISTHNGDDTLPRVITFKFNACSTDVLYQSFYQAIFQEKETLKC